MSTPDTTTPSTSGLEALASQAQQGMLPTSAPEGNAAPAEDQQNAEAMAKIEASVQAMIFGLLKLARNALAQRLPEIREEWPDELLRPPAEASIPVIRKKFAKLMAVAQADPDVAVLVVSLVPLFLGAMNAWAQAQARLAKEEKPAPAAPPGGMVDGSAG